MRVMPCLAGVALAATAALAAGQGANTVRSTESFDMRVVATGLDGPWEVTYGPDDHLWVTERSGKRVVRINPVDGSRVIVASIPEVYRVVTQDGLLGLALHPDFGRGTGSDFVYVAFTYTDTGSPGPRMMIRRYRYDAAAVRLVDPTPILTNLPANNDHQGGRLVIGPDRKLYFSIGDQGANWLANRCRPNRALDLPTAADVSAKNWSAYEGKILRIELDGSIPTDNPTIDGVRSHVFSYGHRNPLGLVFGPAGLYDSEHGPEVDDEVNLIEAGKNYGWPRVAGFKDDKVYAWADWTSSKPTPCAELPSSQVAPPSIARQPESSYSHPDFTEPLRTFFTAEVAPDGQMGRTTIAPGGLDIVVRDRGGVPGWNDSLLVLSLIHGVVYRLPLTPDGRKAAGPPVETFRTQNRYRDIAVHPNQRVFYIATDSTGSVRNEANALTSQLANRGAILEFTWRQ